MIPSEFLPWMIAFLSISLLFIVFAIFLCCVLGENYNSFRAKLERRGKLQKARNLIKLVPLGYVKANPRVILADKNTQISRFLLNDLKNHSSKKIKFEIDDYKNPDSILPAHTYYGVRPLILASSVCNLTPRTELGVKSGLTN